MTSALSRSTATTPHRREGRACRHRRRTRWQRAHAARRVDEAEAVDPTLSFRARAAEGVCGSDAMNINGKNGLGVPHNMRTLPASWC